VHLFFVVITAGTKKNQRSGWKGKLNISSATDVVPTDHARVEKNIKNPKVNQQ